MRVVSGVARTFGTQGRVITMVESNRKYELKNHLLNLIVFGSVI
jgi:hypothetical protein